MDSYHSSSSSSHHNLTSHLFSVSADFDATVPSHSDHSEQQPAPQPPLPSQGLAPAAVPTSAVITKRKSPSGYLVAAPEESMLDPSLVQSSSSSAANKKQKLPTNGDHLLGQIGYGLDLPTTSGLNETSSSSSSTDLPVLVPGTGASGVPLTMQDGSIQVNDDPPHQSQFGKTPKNARQRVSTVKAAEPTRGAFANGSHHLTTPATTGAAAAPSGKVTKGKGRLAAKYEHARPVPLPEDILVASAIPINPLMNKGDIPVAPELTSVSNSLAHPVDISVDGADAAKPSKPTSKATKSTSAAAEVAVKPPTASTSMTATEPAPEASESTSADAEASTSTEATASTANAVAGSSKAATEAATESLITQEVIDASKVAPDSEKGRLGQQHACPYEGCDKSFVRKSDFLRHYRIHTGERPFTCPVPGCGKTFIQRSALTVHLRTHTGDKPLSCDLCGRAFSDSSSLARHRRVHSGEKRFHCKRCNQRQFSRKITLIRHLELCDGSGDTRNRTRPAKKLPAKARPSVAGTGSSAGEEDESYDEDRDADGEADYENEEEFNAALVLAGGNAPKRATPSKSPTEGEEPQSGSGEGSASAAATPLTKTRAGRAAAAAAFNATPGAKRDAPPVKSRKTRSSLPAAGAAGPSSPATTPAAAPPTVPRAGRGVSRPRKSGPSASTSNGKGKTVAAAAAPEPEPETDTEVEAEAGAAEEEPKEVEMKTSPAPKENEAAPVEEAKEKGEEMEIEAGPTSTKEKQETDRTTEKATTTATTDE